MPGKIMNYELTTFWRTIRKEGMSSAFAKICVYFSQIIRCTGFIIRSAPHISTPEAAVDYACSKGHGLFDPGQVRSEIKSLCELVSRQKPKTVLEIGTANGGTFFLWCQMAATDAELISLDLPGGIHGGGYPFWRTYLYRSFAQKEQKVHLVRGNSHEPGTVEHIRQILNGRQIDFLFIDGDHTFDGVRADFESYSPLVRSGGIIAFHDICKHPPEIQCEVDRYWSEIRSKYENVEFVENSNQGWAGIGIVFAM